MVYLSLGSNLGDRYTFIKLGLDNLLNIAVGRRIRCSRIYETEPWGVANQPKYLNCVVELESQITPEALLNYTQEIEHKAGRIRSGEPGTVRWGARTLDIDILMFDDMLIEGEILTIPHKLMMQRNFVLVPLAELAPDLLIPGSLKAVQQVLDECQDTISISIWEPDCP